MRKETILKFEKEFIAWCKGESVLLGAPTSMVDRTLTWKEVSSFEDWKALDTKYILDDDYSIYRKALAEGKTVEKYIYASTCPEWEEMNPTDKFKECAKYRIKPEEPKFKVGDWVRYINTPNQIERYNGKQYHSKVNIELWKPKSGEWCWFFNTNFARPLLARFIDMEPNNYFKSDYHIGTGTFSNCEPFIGTLPTNLKEH